MRPLAAEPPFLVDALRLLLGPLLLIALTVMSTLAVLTLSVFSVLTYTGCCFLVILTADSMSSIWRALRLYLASMTIRLMASLGLSVFSTPAISFIVIISGFVALLRNL